MVNYKITMTPRSYNPLLRDNRLLQVLAAIRPKLVDQVSRIRVKNRAAPTLRVDEHVAAQRYKCVRDSIRSLMRGRQWQFVTFSQFTEELSVVAEELFKAVSNDARSSHVCFVIDELHKSSFWVLALSLFLVPEAGRKLFAEKKVSMAVHNDGTYGGIRRAFEQLPDDTSLVLMDDAVYSGEQLSHLYGLTQRYWDDTRSSTSRSRANIAVVVPFMSTPSLRLFKGANTICHNHFGALFYRRSLSKTLLDDVFLARSGGVIFTEYMSLYFDFLGLQSTNTLMIFEHKIADFLSIPHRWLMVGPCVSREIRVAYKIRPDAVDRLLDMIQDDVDAAGVEMFRYAPTNMRRPPPHRDAAHRVVSLMQSSQFRSAFMTRVKLSADRRNDDDNDGDDVLYAPIFPPEYCDIRYRRYIDKHVASVEHDTASAFHVPECRKPPYKRASFAAAFRK